MVSDKLNLNISRKSLLFSRADIDRRVRELGRMISRDYAGGGLMVIGVLKGAFLFVADLVRRIDLPLEVDFIRVASYGDDLTGGELRLVKDVELAVAGRDVLIVEDIVDSGRTMAFLLDFFSDRRLRSLKVCALIDKKQRRQREVNLDYAGFAVKDGFLVGYGLDYAEQYRHYSEIYRLQTTE